MLPLPSSTRTAKHRDRDRDRDRGFYSSQSLPLSLSSSQLFTVLRTRARLTNLAVAILAGTLCLSLVINTSYLLSSSSPSALLAQRWSASREWDDLASASQLDSGRPPSIETTIERDPRMADVDHLIVVPGHAVWTGSDPSLAHLDHDWVLEQMQKGGSVRTYIRHIEEAAERLASDPHALLVFSGGATRPHLSTPLSEGASYHRLATALSLLPTVSTSDALPLSARATIEEFALDSYENLVFSLARFREVTGRWPARVTVVGYGMKRHRFEQLHRGAIKFPADQFEYVGIDDEGDTTEHYAGELKYGYVPFLFSPSGCRPPLSIKRQSRNPFARYHPYHASCPELAGLLEWCPPATAVSDVAVPVSLQDELSGSSANGGLDRNDDDDDDDDEFNDPADRTSPPKGFIVYDGPVPWGGSSSGGTYDRERD